ncbi:AraC family transcriptional regulator [Pseudomonas aeruginosa]|uniref:AraC family transcriptional regulator n=1 Tax=Salmonella enterica TaxID=28901 RepID=A0A5V4L9Q4_SALER|nr:MULTISPECIES: AraC family transcriptional regulator [Pseudomonadota]EAU0154376.1 AraC family transcriptional regulator [Salmonella enterica]ECC8337259.1 AraC family transcriptional regulator [Salmonella enterica subsp. enterica serovar Ruiru]EBH3757007.1 AraC family transcriptional regulator [Salmonella enterica]EBU2435223.1 AraC family transcriptional regulator [Salmonella enterica]ECD9771483.1 AraC family transcriptional regulator [Salmonella enterica]
MAELILQLAPQEGHTRSLLDGVRLMRADRPLGRTPVLYEPSIVIVCQGHKRGYLANRVYHYDPQHYLVLSVPLPFSTETDASPQEPLLAVSVRLDMTAVADLVIEVDQQASAASTAPAGIVSTPLDATLADTTVRLLRALRSPLEARVLGPAIVRELCFRVLLGEQGGAIRAALASHGNFGRIARVLRRIHTDYAQSLDVAALAREAGLSVPAFHAHFKTVAATSPIQYIKSVRLHQARLMMIRDHVTAAGAAVRVGYESPSQFNREFKRLFGRSPGEEAREMRSAFALMEPAQLEVAAVTH